MTLGVRALVYDKAEKSIFLIRHTYTNGWHLPGGGVEFGETAEDSLRRELQEEGNIVLIGEPQLRSLHFNRPGWRDHVALYLVTAFIQTEPKQPDREIAEATFFPVAELPLETTDAVRRRLAEVIDDVKADGFW